jgi:hypothetical protein
VLRGGITTTVEGQRIEWARQELEELGVQRINVNHSRPFGRAAEGQQPDVSGLLRRVRHRENCDRPGRQGEAVRVAWPWRRRASWAAGSM